MSHQPPSNHEVLTPRLSSPPPSLSPASSRTSSAACVLWPVPFLLFLQTLLCRLRPRTPPVPPDFLDPFPGACTLGSVTCRLHPRTRYVPPAFLDPSPSACVLLPLPSHLLPRIRPPVAFDLRLCPTFSVFSRWICQCMMRRLTQKNRIFVCPSSKMVRNTWSLFMRPPLTRSVIVISRAMNSHITATPKAPIKMREVERNYSTFF